MTVIIDGYKDTDLGLLPVEWAVENLDSICDILDSKRKPIKAADRSSGEYPYYGASGIIDWVTDYLFDEDLILLGEDGENIVSRNLPLAFRVSGKCWINNHAHVFRISDNNRDSVDFITMVLEAKDYSKLVVGSAQPKITQEQCKKLRLQRPPLPEQQKIADILTTVDDHISETESLIEKTKVLKQGLMQQLLTKGIGHTEFKDTEIGRIPVEWEVKRLEDIAKQMGGFAFKSNEFCEDGIVVIKINNITDEGFNYANKTYYPLNKIDEFRSFIPDVDDILMTMTGNIGRVAYVKSENLPCLVNQRVGRVRVKNIAQTNPLFLYHYFNTPFYRQLLADLSAGGAQQNISTAQINSTLIPLPPLSEQRQIAAILTSVDDQIDTYQAKLASLTRLKTGLMQQLLTGKIRVTV